jgi:dolichol-phosphate mannosyltransferase
MTRMTDTREFSVIVPTFNEARNVTILVNQLDEALRNVNWEVVFVDDDSSDGTLDELQALSRADPRVRYIHRIGRRGLASAVVEGMLATSAPYLAVIDGDLQHDPTRLPIMLELLREAACDVAVGTRYSAEGGVGTWSRDRLRMSQVATRLANYMFPVPIADPMSGFFAITRPAFLGSVRQLSNQGYKILLDIVLSSRQPLQIREVPYTFANRLHGQSKLDSSVAVDYVVMLLDKKIGHFVPPRFLLFATVGASGVLVHMAVLSIGLAILQAFSWAQATATLVAMTYNFFINNLLTYRDKRLQGLWPKMQGLLSFYAICGIGAASNVGVASVLFEREYSWWLAAFGGILVGLVWNYAMTATFTWRR